MGRERREEGGMLAIWLADFSAAMVLQLSRADNCLVVARRCIRLAGRQIDQ